MDKEKRITLFQKTEKIYEIYQELYGITTAIHIKPQSSFSFNKKINPVIIKEKYSLEDIPKGNTAILVFCSAKNPGGGVLRGSRAQEEDIALVSSWYFQIKDQKDFYLPQGASAINTDDMLYTKKSYVFYDQYYQELNEPQEVSFIGATAPNLNGLIAQNKAIKDVYEVMRRRITNLLGTAEKLGKENLVLGAWGTGVFGLDIHKVLQLFYEEINKGYFSGQIYFNIPNKDICELFRQKFNINKPD